MMKSVVEGTFEKFYILSCSLGEIDYQVLAKRYRALKRQLQLRYAVYSVQTSLFDIIALGRCVFWKPKDDLSRNGVGEFVSREYVDPTYIDAYAELENQIHHTGDRHHIYLEDVSLEKVENGIKFLRLTLGS